MDGQSCILSHSPFLPGGQYTPKSSENVSVYSTGGPPADSCVGPGAFGDLNSPPLSLSSEEAPLVWGQERSAPRTTS